MNIGETLRQTVEGTLAWVTNELRVYARNNDAAKVRVGAPGDHGGCLSFNKVWLDGAGAFTKEAELGLLQIKQDETTRDDPQGTRAELTLHLNNGREDLPEDQRMVPVLLIRTNGYTFLVPNIQAPEHPPDNPGTPLPPTAPAGSYDGASLVGSEGKFLYVRQRDGHDVLYACNAGVPVKAIWASNGGPHGTWLG